MSIRKNIIAGWMAHLVTVLIGFFMMPYVLGVLGEVQYGTWVFLNAVAGYAALVYAGFGGTICRYVADAWSRKDLKRLNAVVSTIQVIYLGTAAIVFILASLFAWYAPACQNWDGMSLFEVRVSILVLGATIGIGMVASVYGGVLIGTQRFDYKRGIELATGVLRLVLTVLCLYQHYGLITLAAIFFATTIFEHGVSAWLAYRQVPGLSVVPWLMRWSVLKECFGFSAFSAVSLVAEYLIFFTDTVIISLIKGPLAVVPYQIGLRVAQMIQVPIAQIGEVVLPKAGELHARSNPQELGRVVARGMGLSLLLTGGFLIGSVYFGDLLIRTWIGKIYDSSGTVLVLLVASQVIALPMVVARKALMGIGQVKFQAFVDLLEGILNLVLSLILIRYWGIVGVAWGTVIPLTVIELCCLLPHACRRLHLTPRLLWQHVLAPQIPSLVALLVFCELAAPHTPEHGWLALLSVSIAGGGVLIGTRILLEMLEKRVRMTPAAALSQAEILG
jgi:O-antigen/teichoic acid export membrane protein